MTTLTLAVLWVTLPLFTGAVLAARAMADSRRRFVARELGIAVERCGTVPGLRPTGGLGSAPFARSGQLRFEVENEVFRPMLRSRGVPVETIELVPALVFRPACAGTS